MTTIILLRHGESEANGKSFFAGQKNVPLSPRGHMQARLAAELGGVIPEIAENGGRIRYSGMFDPKLRALLREQGGDFTPVSLELDLGPTVITGANMGGKSVAVRAAALNAYLAVCGMPVFAQSLTLPHIPDMFLLAEDAEDARGGLSSFGGEMIRFDGILKEIAKKPGALVLIDEFARGTNPHEGAALVRAAVRYFNEKKTAFALITTHFDDVACLAPVHYQVMGLRRADEEELTRALSAAGTAGEGKTGGTDPRRRLLAKYMDYGLFRADGASNPPRDALKICRALRISDEFMSFVRE